jgi:hypothetical protein
MLPLKAHPGTPSAWLSRYAVVRTSSAAIIAAFLTRWFHYDLRADRDTGRTGIRILYLPAWMSSHESSAVLWPGAQSIS